MTMSLSEIGCLGTLRLTKRHAPHVSIAAYPIDDSPVTLGRDPACSVRLYYPSVSPVHAEIAFRDRKAFILVLGSAGLGIDGCHVLPSSDLARPTTVPLPNESVIEIHGKRFVFTYPPKPLRESMTDAFGTPVTPTNRDTPPTPDTRRRMLRMSMIRSAEVFTPRPSSDPTENLRILRTPLRRRSPSPLKQEGSNLRWSTRNDDDSARDESERKGEEEIVLVDGDHPHVLEEGKDLVILESVEVDLPVEQIPVTPSRLGAFGRQTGLSGSSIRLGPYQTPRRRGVPPSLHRAVLIRSAQRAILKEEMEKEEEREEMEVEEFIAKPPDELQPLEDEDHAQEEELVTEEHGDNEDDGHQVTEQGVGWRKGLDLIQGFGWPFRSSSVIPAEIDEPAEAPDMFKVEAEPVTLPNGSAPEYFDETNFAPFVATKEQTPMARRTLGSFMTPQVVANTGMGRGSGRNSFGGVTTLPGGARRVRIEPKWRVADIVVPLVTEEDEGVKQTADVPVVKQESPRMPTSSRKASLSEKERQAIRERRRSALTMPDPYFGGQVPGLGSRRLSTMTVASPTPLPSLLATATLRLSPTKTQTPSPTKLAPHVEDQSESEEEDTRSLLDRMKMTMEGMKRRRSVGLFCGDEEGHKLFEEGGYDPPEDSQAKQSDEDDGDEKENVLAASDNPVMDVEMSKDAIQVDAPLNGLTDEKDEDAPASLSPPALTRCTAHAQTPQFESLKHLFSAHNDVPDMTPAMRSVRYLFRDVPGDADTPQMDGVDGMFVRAKRNGQRPATPEFDGIGKMMLTSEACHRQTSGDDSSQMLHGTPMTVASTTARRRTPRADGCTTDSTTKLQTPLEENAAAVAAVQIHPEMNHEGPGPASRKARLLRGKKQPVVDESGPPQPTPPLPNAEPRITGTKKATAEAEPVAMKRPPSRARVAPIPEVTVEAKVTRSESTRPKSRLAMKAGAPNETPVEAHTKTTRGMRRGTAASEPRRRTVPTKAIDADEGEEDPLDTIRPEKGVPMPALRRRTRTAPVAKVKQEEDEAALVAPKGTAVEVGVVPPSTSRAQVTGTTARNRSAGADVRKRVAAGVASTGEPASNSRINKENTPSREEEDSACVDAAGGGPTRVTRGKRGVSTVKAANTKEGERQREDAGKPKLVRTRAGAARGRA